MKTMQKHDRACNITPVGKRRDGGTRYWCLAHKADATAKYGRRAKVCRAAHLPPILPEEILELDLDQYPGGVALWGAVPPIYDTTRLPLDFGIHVHARKDADGDKVIDRTYRGVRLIGRQLPSNGLLISEIDAVYYMVSSVFGFDTRNVRCTFCGYPHLDKDWFSIHPHRRHLCAGCGKNFRDTVLGIGNPIRATQEILGLLPRKPTESSKNPLTSTARLSRWHTNLGFQPGNHLVLRKARGRRHPCARLQTRRRTSRPGRDLLRRGDRRREIKSDHGPYVNGPKLVAASRKPSCSIEMRLLRRNGI